MSNPLNVKRPSVTPSNAKNLQNAKRLNFIVGTEDTATLADIICELAEKELGIAFDIHVGKKESRDGGTYPGGFMYVRALEKYTPSGGNQPPPKRKFKRRSQTNKEEEVKTAKAVAEKTLEDDFDL